jgi:hypothetical protein
MSTVDLARRIGLCLGALAWLAPAACLALVGPSSEAPALDDHVVMVLIRGDGKAGFCSGVVLGPRAILTAGHCAKPARDMRVFYRDRSGAPVFVEVEAVVMHPQFNSDAIARRVVSIDLAMIETRTPLDQRFSAVDLDTTGETAIGQSVLAAGFGVAREGEQKSAGVLRGAELAVREPLSKVLVWATDHGGAVAGACTGDSGGPMLAGDSMKLLAIIAWSQGKPGSHCGALTQGILVAPVRGWIDATIGAWSR